jgi:hypothetical protein
MGQTLGQTFMEFKGFYRNYLKQRKSLNPMYIGVFRCFWFQKGFVLVFPPGSQSKLKAPFYIGLGFFYCSPPKRNNF